MISVFNNAKHIYAMLDEFKKNLSKQLKQKNLFNNSLLIICSTDK